MSHSSQSIEFAIFSLTLIPCPIGVLDCSNSNPLLFLCFISSFGPLALVGSTFSNVFEIIVPNQFLLFTLINYIFQLLFRNHINVGVTRPALSFFETGLFDLSDFLDYLQLQILGVVPGSCTLTVFLKSLNIFYADFSLLHFIVVDCIL